MDERLLLREISRARDSVVPHLVGVNLAAVVFLAFGFVYTVDCRLSAFKNPQACWDGAEKYVLGGAMARIGQSLERRRSRSEGIKPEPPAAAAPPPPPDPDADPIASIRRLRGGGHSVEGFR
jgi:hypothetical protein